MLRVESPRTPTARRRWFEGRFAGPVFHHVHRRTRSCHESGVLSAPSAFKKRSRHVHDRRLDQASRHGDPQRRIFRVRAGAVRPCFPTDARVLRLSIIAKVKEGREEAIREAEQAAMSITPTIELKGLLR